MHDINHAYYKNIMTSKEKIVEPFKPYFDDDGYMTPVFDIRKHLLENKTALNKLNKLSKILTNLDRDQIGHEENKLENALASANGYTKKIIDHVQALHDDYASSVVNIAQQGKMTKEGLTNYFIQGLVSYAIYS